MSDANDIQEGCDAIPNLVAACHCGDESLHLSYDGEQKLDRVISYLEDTSCIALNHIQCQLTGIDESADWLENHRDNHLADKCEACNQCREFTWKRCETCNGLAGERHALAQIFPGTKEEPIYYSSCIDCLIYVANGDLPEDLEDEEE